MLASDFIIELRFMLNDMDTNTDLQRFMDDDMFRIISRGLVKIRSMRSDAMYDDSGDLYATDVTLVTAATALPIKQSLIPALLSYTASQALLNPAAEVYNQSQSGIHYKEFEAAIQRG